MTPRAKYIIGEFVEARSEGTYDPAYIEATKLDSERVVCHYVHFVGWARSTDIWVSEEKLKKVPIVRPPRNKDSSA